MQYREKVAWLSLLSMLLVFVPYFTWAELHPPGPDIPNFSQMAIYACASLSWAVILGIGHLRIDQIVPQLRVVGFPVVAVDLIERLANIVECVGVERHAAVARPRPG